MLTFQIITIIYSSYSVLFLMAVCMIMGSTQTDKEKEIKGKNLWSQISVIRAKKREVRAVESGSRERLISGVFSYRNNNK